MLDKTTTKFSHVKPADTPWRSDGLRDFFLYKDLGVAEATSGRVIAHLVKSNMAPEKGTGWHRHEAEFQIVFMTKGWARFMYGDQETLVEAGDCVHQREHAGPKNPCRVLRCRRARAWPQRPIPSSPAWP